jgi:hypothetical protein
MDQVARELVGFIPSVYRNSSAEMAGKDQTVRYPISAPVAGEDIAPGDLPKDSGDTTEDFADMKITKARAFPVRITGEDYKTLDSQPGLYDLIMQDRFAQAIRAAVNEIETDLAGQAIYASRAYGTPGTTPFATSMADIAAVKKILKDNGCPDGDISLIIDTAAGLNMRSLTQYLQVSAAGNDRGLREGVLLPLQGIDVRESAQVAYHNKGTATGIDVNFGAGYNIGDRILVCDGSDSGTLLDGDLVTFAGDVNKYLIAPGNTITGAAAGNVSLAKPGLRASLANAVEMTIGGSYRANLAFHRSALHLVTRAPASPKEGDSAIDSAIITDPISGLSFEVRAYAQYRRVKYEVALAWGCKMVKPEFAAVLLG